MHSQHLHASTLKGTGQHYGVFVRLAPAGAHFQGDGDIARSACGDHGFDDRQRQGFVLHQRRASPFVTDLFGWAAHVDVDDLGAAFNVVDSGVGHHLRFGTRNLHRNRTGLTLVVGTARGLERVPQIAPGCDHFTDRIASPQALAQLAEWPIGYTRHGCNKQGIRHSELADVHMRFFRSVGCDRNTEVQAGRHSNCSKFQQLKLLDK